MSASRQTRRSTAAADTDSSSTPNSSAHSARRRSSAAQQNAQHQQFLASQAAAAAATTASTKYSKRNNASNRNAAAKETGENFFDYENQAPVWPYYCVHVGQFGARNIDQAAHVVDMAATATDVSTFDFLNLRPVSGLRNHIKRNLLSNSKTNNNNNVMAVDVIKETDLIHRISNIRTLKQLDLSFNNIQSYPRQLCDLDQLETLNLSNNDLQETDFPNDMEKYQNLIELVLDNNKLRKFPKCLSKYKGLSRLSLKGNSLVELKYLENFKKLRHLILDSNNISNLDENNYRHLERLEILSVSNNSLISLPSNLIRTTFKHLRRIDLSSNQLQTVTSELFMLAHIESINLSGNRLVRLPMLPSSYVRPVPIYSIDLSSNQITTLNDYLLLICLNVDLSSNRIRVIPLKMFKKLNEKHYRTRNLRLDDNPLVDPPLEYCQFGLRVIYDYLVQNFKKLQLNKGFKLVLLGDTNSGKTALSYALEDYHTQTNLIEQFFSSSNSSSSSSMPATGSQSRVDEDNNESTKFIDIHEFLFKSSDDDDQTGGGGETFITTSAPTSAALQRTANRKSSVQSIQSVKSFKSSGRPSSKTSKSPPKATGAASRSSKLLSAKAAEPQQQNDLNAFGASAETVEGKKTCMMNVRVFDLNGSLSQYAHVIDYFLDRSSLILLCIDASRFLATNNNINVDSMSSNDLNENEKQQQQRQFVASMSTVSSGSILDEQQQQRQQQQYGIDWERNLRGWLDLCLLKLSKSTSFHILPVLTKCDKVNKKFSKKNSLTEDYLETTTASNMNMSSSSSSIGGSNNLLRVIISKVENLIASHLNDRLNDINVELKKIEAMQDITPSQSDRLKQLVQTRANLNPNIYKSILCVSSLKMEGIGQLTNAIREIVYNNPRQFPDVNKKVPTFWIDVEEHACNVLSAMSFKKLYEEDSQRSMIAAANGYSPSPPVSAASINTDTNVSALFVHYKTLKDRLVEKYGMSKIIEHIIKYMHFSGKIIWFYETEMLRDRVFLQPHNLFNMLYVLFRADFHRNFLDQHLRSMRAKLTRNTVDMSDESLQRLQRDLLDKGSLKVDLLKLLWYPILIIDSTQSLLDVFTILSFYFRIGYPDQSKDKLKAIYAQFQTKQQQQLQGNINTNSSDYDDHSTVYSASLLRQSKASFISYDQIIIPHYLPLFDLETNLGELQAQLSLEAANAADSAFTAGVKVEPASYLAKIAHKYEFPWGVVSGLFERFCTSCVILSDLYNKLHFNNLLMAYNEDNSIGVLIYFIPASIESGGDSGEETCRRSDRVMFEFYLISYQSVIESTTTFLNSNNNNNKDVTKQQPPQQQPQQKQVPLDAIQTTIMDLDQLWTQALKILQLFEDTIANSYPSLRYDRFTQCPDCQHFSFLGEWLTPKELQKATKKICPDCQKSIDYIYLVKPSIGKNPALDLKKLQTRLENLAKLHSTTGATNNNNNTSSNPTSANKATPIINNTSSKQPSRSKQPSIASSN